MQECDTEKTQELAELLGVESGQRDEQWKIRFYDIVPRAALAVPDSQGMVGPDGFVYLILELPQPDSSFAGYSLVKLLDHLLASGLGLMVSSGGTVPDWVFSYGCLWSYREFGHFEVSTASPPGSSVEVTAAGGGLEKHTYTEDHEVIVGQPTDLVLPQYARRTIRAFFQERLKVSNPAVFLLADPDRQPKQALVFSVFPEDFDSQESFARVMKLLTWFLPPHYELSAISRNSGMAAAFRPL